MSAGGHETLRLLLAGGCTLVTGRGAVIAVRSRKARALLGVLSVSQGRAVPRDRAAGLFWSDFEDEKARASLRQCLKILRQELGPVLADVIVADRELVSLDRRRVDSDIMPLLQQVADGRFDHPLLQMDLISEALFAGFDDLDQEFSSWLAVFREQTRQQLMAGLERGLVLPHGTDARHAAAQSLLRLDGAHEQALRVLMEEEAERGNRPAALRHFELFSARLRKDYGVGPAADTSSVYARLRAEGQEAESAASVAVVPGPGQLPLIAVHATGMEAHAAAHGFVLTLLRVLSRFRNFSVVSVRDAGGAAPGGRQADFGLEIAPQPEEEGQLSLHLFNLPEHETLWTAQVAVSAAAISNAQETIVRGLCGALNVYLSENQLQRLRIKASHNQSAIEKWMRGQHLLGVWEPDTEQMAETLFLEAIAAAPDHALLHANLADVYNARHIVFPGMARERATEQKAMQLARRAVALDPLEPRSHVTLGWSQTLAGKPAQAVYSFLRGHELNPAEPVIAMSAAHGLAVCGELSKAFELSRAAFAGHPSPPWHFYGFDSNIRFLAGDYLGSIDAAERSGEVAAYILGWKCAAHGMAQTGRAAAAAEDFLERTRANWHGKQEPTDAAILAWFVDIFPFARSIERERLIEGLRKAGLPVSA